MVSQGLLGDVVHCGQPENCVEQGLDTSFLVRTACIFQIMENRSGGWHWHLSLSLSFPILPCSLVLTWAVLHEPRSAHSGSEGVGFPVPLPPLTQLAAGKAAPLQKTWLFMGGNFASQQQDVFL